MCLCLRANKINSTPINTTVWCAIIYDTSGSEEIKCWIDFSFLIFFPDLPWLKVTESSFGDIWITRPQCLLCLPVWCPCKCPCIHSSVYNWWGHQCLWTGICPYNSLRALLSIILEAGLSCQAVAANTQLCKQEEWWRVWHAHTVELFILWLIISQYWIWDFTDV